MTDRAPTAFVTGGTGFVGSHLVEALLDRGYGEVRCLVRSEPKWLAGLPVKRVRGTLDDPRLLADALRGVDYVYHVAGLTRAPALTPLMEANVAGTLSLMHVVEAMENPPKSVLVTSTLAVIGEADTPVADESTPMNPVSLYGISKARMEHALCQDGWMDRLPLVVVRPPAVYGPRDNDILDFFKSVDRGLCPVIGSGTHPTVSLVHVRDLVRGMILAAESPGTQGETFFVGSEAFYSWHEVRDAALKALGRRALTIHVPGFMVPAIGAASEIAGRAMRKYPALNRDKANEILNAVKMCSVEKAMRQLGYRQEIDLESGVAETIAWYREAGLLSRRRPLEESFH